MRKQDLKIGTDYAISRWDGDGPHQATYMGPNEKGHEFRMATLNPYYWKTGETKTFTSRQVAQPWDEWVEVAERRRLERAETARLADEVREQMRAALAVLGLKPRGLFDTATKLSLANVVLGGEELVELAERFREVQP